MDAPAMKVKCNVDCCEYNQGKMCHASDIAVDPMGDNNVESNAGTQCSTFVKSSTM